MLTAVIGVPMLITTFVGLDKWEHVFNRLRPVVMVEPPGSEEPPSTPAQT
jgi:hypothetical protein